jgi:hypothetical protein
MTEAKAFDQNIDGNIETSHTINPRNLANLRPPWRKGECPNPAGRPPNVPLARAYRALLRSLQRGDRSARVYVRRLAQALHGENTESTSQL